MRTIHMRAFVPIHVGHLLTTTNYTTCSIKAEPASAVRQPQSVCVS